MKLQLCVMCKHFQMDEGHVYSEHSSDPASVGCGKMYWKIFSIRADDEFRQAIKKAQTCKDYDDAE